MTARRSLGACALSAAKKEENDKGKPGKREDPTVSLEAFPLGKATLALTKTRPRAMGYGRHILERARSGCSCCTVCRKFIAKGNVRQRSSQQGFQCLRCVTPHQARGMVLWYGSFAKAAEGLGDEVLEREAAEQLSCIWEPTRSAILSQPPLVFTLAPKADDQEDGVGVLCTQLTGETFDPKLRLFADTTRGELRARVVAFLGLHMDTPIAFVTLDGRRIRGPKLPYAYLVGRRLDAHPKRPHRLRKKKRIASPPPTSGASTEMTKTA
jgi:hypothetical protein